MRFSLRARVLAATLLLVALGLAVAGFATYSLLRKSLVNRLDDQVVAARTPLQFELISQLRGDGDGRGLGGPGGPGPPPDPESSLPVGTYAALYDTNGHRIAELALTYTGDIANRPDLSVDAARAAAAATGINPPIRSVGAIGHGTGPGGSGFRMGIFGVAAFNGTLHEALVVGLPLDELNATLHRLVLVEVGVAAAVVVAIGLLSWWLVRLGLRPLDRMAVTAGAIAAGDLSRRVEPEDERTEVGRLGTALNTMLGRIETSFDEQRASEARLRRFVADASHELRTPLTSIRGYAELFRRGAADRPEDLERAMRRIEDEGARMGLLVDDLLLLARLDQGRPLDRRPVDLTALVADAGDDLRAADPARAVTVDALEGVRVDGDEPRLRQVIANVVDNARTHTPPGTAVSIRLAVDGDTAVLEVADRGPGMSDEESARVFERFYRGDPSRSRASGGTGLGLSIAAAIVDAHGGGSGVSSEPGRGTKFRITLPLAAPAAGPTSDEPASVEPEPEHA
jgi:two-component system, OmpR family, sensor kinase